LLQLIRRGIMKQRKKTVSALEGGKSQHVRKSGRGVISAKVRGTIRQTLFAVRELGENLKHTCI